MTAPKQSANSHFIIGVDGGGSKTTAVAARASSDGGYEVLGRGRSGPSNLQLNGAARSLANLHEAITEAIESAALTGTKIDTAVLALAGCSQAEVIDQVRSWADGQSLADRVAVVHDTAPIMAEGTPDGIGIALIAGTGSVAIGLNDNGDKVFRGGWGHWFGDQGSGFDIARNGLNAVSLQDDGLGPSTRMTEDFLRHFNIDSMRQITQELSRAPDLRKHIASLAPIVLQAAEADDAVALAIVDRAAADLADLVLRAAQDTGFDNDFPLALSGGIIQSSPAFRALLLEKLKHPSLRARPVTFVTDPVMGCLKIALSADLTTYQVNS